MTMRYIRIERRPDGFLVDPAPYLATLPEIEDRLPPGAAAFVRADGHYDVMSENSVKELKISRMELIDSFARLELTVELAYNQIQGVPRLNIRYDDVANLTVEVTASFQIPSDWIVSSIRRLGDVLADEVLPHDHGCVHVIETIHGTISVVARDLIATWTEDD